jgi:XRE family transcriptional regulator, regulator of sulfur utilization
LADDTLWVAKDLRRAFGKRVRELRKAREWSQEEMGEACDLHWTYIGQVERGERNLTLESIQKIAYGLRMTISELFKGIG